MNILKDTDFTGITHPTDDRWVTAAELFKAVFSGMATPCGKTLQRWRSSWLPSQKVGNQYMYNISDVKAAMRAREGKEKTDD